MSEGWREMWPELKIWVEGLDGRREFVETRPVMFEVGEEVV